MRAKLLLLGLIASLLAAPVRADPTHYVSLDGTNDVGNNYNTWSGAATQIQWAVDVAGANDTVLVSNGTYILTNQISITKGIIVQSFKGRTDTFINGNYPLYTNRCVYITHSDAVLDGFTVANGCLLSFSAPSATGGGGIYVTNGLVINCTITSNQAGTDSAIQGGGGGVFMGPAGILSNCTVSLNVVTNNGGSGGNGGGGVWMDGGGLIVSCVITGNTMTTNGAQMMGGGVALAVGGTIKDSEILNNAAYYGGGLHFNQSGTADHCTIRGNGLNLAGVGYGAGVSIYAKGTLTRCVISESTNIGAAILAAAGVYITTGGGTIDNCVISNNYSTGIIMAYGGAASYVSNSIICLNKWIGVENSGSSGYLRNCLIYGNPDRNVYFEFCVLGVMENCTILNGDGGLSAFTSLGTMSVSSCIIYSNTSYDIKNYVTDTQTNINYCCASSTNNLTNTVGNITNNPLFVSCATKDFHLTSASPCVNTGLNKTWMTGTLDLGNHRRLDIFSGHVDMGCYEYIPNGTLFRIP